MKTYLDFAGPLDINWDTQNYILLCTYRFSNFLPAKNRSSTSAKPIIHFLQKCFQLHGIPRTPKWITLQAFLAKILQYSATPIPITSFSFSWEPSFQYFDRKTSSHSWKKLLKLSSRNSNPSLKDALLKTIWKTRRRIQWKTNCSPKIKH